MKRDPSRSALFTVLARIGAPAHTGEQVDPEKALSRALKSGRRIFIGIEMTKAEATASLGRLDDAVAEIVSLVGYRERG